VTVYHYLFILLRKPWDMAGITIENLTKEFSDKGDAIVAVDSLDLTAEDGEFVVLVGPSGCGKTTTLRCIAGLESVTDGEIRLGDEVVTGKPPEDRDIAMVFQSYALYPHMTVRENIGFGLKYSTDLATAEIEERVEDAAEMMGIGELLDRKPADLSGGQQQRVALGRAVVRDPEAFLMDEPLSNLDAKLRAEMRTYLQQLQDDIDVTTVYVTHDQTEAMTMGDRIAVLNDGRLQQYGTPAECYHEPTNTFVAEFLGEPSINLFDMRLRDGTLVAEFLEYDPDPGVRERLSRDEVVAGVRPEALDVSTATPDGRTSFRATVAVVEHLGRESHVHVDVANADAEFTVIVDGRPGLAGGDEVTVDLDPDALHLFDARSGEVVRNATATTEEGPFGASPTVD